MTARTRDGSGVLCSGLLCLSIFVSGTAPRSDFCDARPPRGSPQIANLANRTSTAPVATAHNLVSKDLANKTNRSLQLIVRIAWFLPWSTVAVAPADPDNHLIAVDVGDDHQIRLARWSWNIEPQRTRLVLRKPEKLRPPLYGDLGESLGDAFEFGGIDSWGHFLHNDERRHP